MYGGKSRHLLLAFDHHSLRREVMRAGTSGNSGLDQIHRTTPNVLPAQHLGDVSEDLRDRWRLATATPRGAAVRGKDLRSTWTSSTIKDIGRDTDQHYMLCMMAGILAYMTSTSLTSLRLSAMRLLLSSAGTVHVKKWDNEACAAQSLQRAGIHILAPPTIAPSDVRMPVQDCGNN